MPSHTALHLLFSGENSATVFPYHYIKGRRTGYRDAGFCYVKGRDGTIPDTTNSGINHILYRPESAWEVRDAGNPHYAASNRNPVWAEMTLLSTAVTCSFRGIKPVMANRPAIVNQSLTNGIFDLSGKKIPRPFNFHTSFSSRNHAPGIFICTLSPGSGSRYLRQPVTFP